MNSFVRPFVFLKALKVSVYYLDSSAKLYLINISVETELILAFLNVITKRSCVYV